MFDYIIHQKLRKGNGRLYKKYVFSYIFSEIAPNAAGRGKQENPDGSRKRIFVLCSHSLLPEPCVNIRLDKTDRQKTWNRTDADPQEKPAVSRRRTVRFAKPCKQLLNHSGNHPHERHSEDRKPRHKRKMTRFVFTAPVRELHHEQDMRHVSEPVAELFQRNTRARNSNARLNPRKP